MNKALISEISKVLKILREPYEDDAAYQWRVKYSVIGLQILASLYDKNNDFPADDVVDNSVSHQHVTVRASKLAQIFGVSDIDTGRVLKLYKATGFILSKRNRLTYSQPTFSCVGEVCLARGVHPSIAIGISGLCMLTNHSANDGVATEKMFNLPTIGILQWFERFAKTFVCQKPLPDKDDIEYLNINEPVNKGYWSGNPPTQGNQTLCRTTDKLNYWIAEGTSDGVKCALLPEWRTRGSEYYRIAIAMRVLANNPPRMRMKKYRSTAVLEYNYLLPPAEQNFLELCSWRKDENDVPYRQRLRRIITIGLSPAIIALFEKMGYLIEKG